MNNTDILRQISIFKTLNSGELDKLSGLCEEIMINKSSIIFNEGDKDAALYIILEGKVKITKEIAPDNFKTLAVLPALSMFGELSLFDKGVRSATAAALETCKLLSIDYDKFETLLYSNDKMAVKILREILKEVSGRLRETNEKLQDKISWGLIAKL